MPCKTLSASRTSMARLFMMKSLLLDNKPLVITTDNDGDIAVLRTLATTILGRNVKVLEDTHTLWGLEEKKDDIFVVPVSLWCQSGGLQWLRKESRYDINIGEEISPEKYIEKLIEFGYMHQNYIGELGSYKREGSIISLTEGGKGDLISLEWFGDEVETIIRHDAQTGERIFCKTFSLQKINGEKREKSEAPTSINSSLLENLINDTSEHIILGCDLFQDIEILRNHASVHFSDFRQSGSEVCDVEILSLPHIDAFLHFLREKSHATITVFTRFPRAVEEFCEYNGIKNITITPIRGTGGESFLWKKPDGSELLYITDDIVGNLFVERRTKKSLAKNLDLLLSLSPGDLVVHREHGIARFFAIITKETGNLRREYLELHYSEGDKLFVPITEIYRITKYIGKPDVELTRLSGKEWEKTIEKTEEEISLIAADILETSAKRSLVPGRAFAIFRDKEETFRKAFSYEHTEDQARAIEEIFQDMEEPHPMDRLLSGDVGFGKTEVAMNAIYKAYLSGVQTALISPLLVLADEHYETLTERLSPFGVKVGIMTRMQSEKEIRETLRSLKDGSIHVVVGTHRLLSDDIIFAKLGLLIIDEEHKFGVTHKEKIKKMRVGIDILALSATPIPRSLNLALSGVKKISILATPPKKKKPIETIVTRWDERMIKNAIIHELTRSGQVIIIFNRIRGIESIKEEILLMFAESAPKAPLERGADLQRANQGGAFDRNLTPLPLLEGVQQTPKIVVTHGQMPGDDIEDRIHAFKKHKYDILLTTTIIENGVNFLSANTILIIDPEDFGLASLHQLRGRVGRKDQEGYCYLIYRKTELSKDEKHRLITIANNNHLGAGFEIAMRDMEIRGAGDVLGIKQAGKSKDVGLTLYFRMLEEKVEELKNKKQKSLPVKIELELSYVVDEGYFLSEQDKLQFYREIENVENLEELEEVEEQMIQKTSGVLKGTIGKPEKDSPREKNETKKSRTVGAQGASSADFGGHSFRGERDEAIENLFLLLRVRLLLTEYGVKKLSKVGTYYVFEMIDGADVPMVRKFLERFDPQKYMILLSVQKIRVETRYWKGVREFLESLVR